MKILVLVESSGKIKKIESILNKLKDEYIVKASIGHIRNLNPKKMSIDVNNNFKLEYVIDNSKKKLVSELKKLSEICNLVLLASDEDREGEAIALSLVEELKLKNYKRITFNEITEESIINAVNNPSDINYNMVNSQKTRMILDKIVGYSLCPLLWQNIENRLSAGRVQSVVVKLITDRENEINKFNENSFYKISGNFKESEIKFFFNTKTKVDKKKYIGDIFKNSNKEEILKILENLKKSNIKVKFVIKKDSNRKPSAPYITSTLQQDSNTKLGYNSKKTMMLAQQLYEKGLITYMRTDSTNLSNDVINQCKNYILEKYGEEYFKSRIYSKKSKNAQEAHEAIRPTIIKKDKININEELNKLYNLIWKQTVSSQMSDLKVKVYTIQLEIDNLQEYYFESSIEEIIFLGYLKLSNTKIEKVDNIPKVKEKFNYLEINAIQDFTKSIGRYNEPQLVKTLEKNGIGRPSTFASIITKIQDKNYVEMKNINGEKKNIINFILKNNKIEEQKKEIMSGSEKKKFIPTKIGIMVTEFLTKNFPDIMDYKFTALMEDKLDDIANNKIEMINTLKEFYNPFKCQVDEILSKRPTYPYEIGEYNGNKIIINKGKNGYNDYFRYNNKNYSVDKADITIEDVKNIIENKNKDLIKVVEIKDTKYYIKKGKGNFPPYIQYYKKNKSKPIWVSIGKGYDVENLSLKEIKELIKE